MVVHLVLGGARSGKSSFAESLALAGDGRVDYVATATVADDEMAARVARHRAERSVRCTTHEVPLQLAGTLAELDHPGAVVLVDCLTLWLTNWLVGPDDQPRDGWVDARAALLAQLSVTRGQLLLVSNEVGQGVVPLGASTRRWVDEAGWLHQDVAAAADRVTFLVAGLPQQLK